MVSKAKTRRRSRKSKSGWWTSLNPVHRRRVVRACGATLIVSAVLTASAVAMSGLDAHVQRLLLTQRPAATLTFVDLPEQLAILADGDLHDSLSESLARDWTEDGLCRQMASRLADMGWVSKVNYVRRRSDAHFEISCRYRMPVALVEHAGAFFLVDRNATRLPGDYLYDPMWKLISGVSSSPPPAGHAWRGDDLRSGLAVLGIIQNEPFAAQMSGVSVDNVGGRVDPRGSHVEIMTDVGRIRWGSAPGFEVEENTVEQKRAILLENYRRTGRADGGHDVIDISTFPDRFTIPG